MDKKVRMTSKPTMSRALIANLIAISLTAIVVFGAVWIYSEYAQFKNTSEEMKTRYLEESKRTMRREVESVVSYLDYMRAQTETRLRADIKARVYEAHAIATSLYRRHRDTMPIDQLKDLVKAALRPIRFNNGRGYYFATSLNGVEMLYADRPELEGVDMRNLRGGRGEYVVRDMIDIVRKHDEGFYTYQWTKPGSEGDQHPKIAFVKRFAPFGWFLGTGEYLEDVAADIQQEVLTRIDHVTIGKDGYIFAGTWQGTSLAGPAKGQNLLDTMDEHESSVVRQLIALSKRGGGFFSYVMPQYTGKRPALKLSYVTGIPEWQWYIGSGIYMDEIDAAIEQQRIMMWSHIKNHIINILFIQAGLILLSVILFYRIILKARSQFSTFNQSFARAAGTYEPIQVDALPWREFKRLAQSANDMLAARQAAKDRLKHNEAKYRRLFEQSSDGVFVVDRHSGQFLDANEAAIKLSGHDLERLREMSAKQVLPALVESDLERLAKIHGPTELGQVAYDHPDGRRLVVEIAVVPMDQTSVYGIVRDVTHRIAMEEALREERDNAQQYLDIAEVMMLVINEDQTVSMINKKGCELLGQPEERIIGRPWFDTFVPETVREQLRTGFTEAMAGNRGFDDYHENPVLTASGEERLIAWHNAPIRNESGRVIANLSSGEDITERRRIEEAMRQSERRFRLLADSLPQTVFETDNQGRLTFVNTVAFQLFGYSREEFHQGLNALDMISPEDHPRATEKLMGILQGNQSTPSEYTAASKDGRKFPIIIHSKPIVADRQVVGVRGIIIDLTNQKQLETRLQQAQKMEAIGTLAGGIAHDFNNILSAVIGYTELAMAESAARGENVERYLQGVLKAGARARDLVNQILTFARRADEELKPVKVSTVAKEALKLLRSTIPTSIKIESRIESDELVMADLTQIHQIFMNLCTNAAQAMEDDGGVLQVRLSDVQISEDRIGTKSALKRGQHLKIEVADSGTGIDPEHLTMIFEPYFTTKPVGEGTGLGLSVVHGIVESYGGAIVVDSEPGRGTTFTLFLPTIEQAEEKPAKDAAMSQGGTERILYVDDEQAVVDVGSHILQQMGYRVITQTSSLKALAMFQSAPDDFDLVISDVTMPDLTGDKMAAEMVKLRPDIPIILCTGYSKKLAEKNLTAIGVKALAMKPLSLNDLLKTVRDVLDGVATPLYASDMSDDGDTCEPDMAYGQPVSGE